MVRLDMTVGMRNRVAGKCRSAAMAAGDVFSVVVGRGHAACLRRGEARILGARRQTVPSDGREKKARNPAGFEFSDLNCP
ncbi:hypothetical protein [Ralstonia pseudosolanacearum]|uniref:hypothetical protein n=1 Tax=Ralstonia pseudosolanacearum TaxID=1310165 RepID=UPI0015869FEC|nr:hypothetical protein [Ralstonia pseudosolanacearum]